MKVDGLLIEKNGKMRLLIANWTAQLQVVQIAFAQIAVLRVLDETTVGFATSSPSEFCVSVKEVQGTTVQLMPFAFARLNLHGF